MSMDAADTAYDASRNVVWSGWYTILAGPRPRREHRLLRSASSLLLGAGVMMLAAAPVIGCWPLVEQAANAHVQAEQVRSVVAANWPQQERDVGELRRARAYNAAILASGQPTLGEPVGGLPAYRPWVRRGHAGARGRAFARHEPARRWYGQP